MFDARPRVLARRLFLLVAMSLGFAFLPSTAFADSAGPTDYETDIVDVTPPTDGAVTFSIEGSDAFMRAVVRPGHQLMVLGYDGEPYIRVDADGSVYENHRSESYYYNLERYGGDVPDAADSAAPPEWVLVDDDGEHAWHDHRAHWMAEVPLIGLEPGQSLPEDQVDVVVDDEPTKVIVATRLMRRASWGWPIAGVALGAAVAYAAIRGGTRTLLGVGLAAALVGVVVGVAHAWAVPDSTGRPLWWWLPPAVAVATLGVGVAFRRDTTLVGIIMVGVGIELAIWGAFGLPGLTAAYRPTVLPAGVERAFTAALPVCGIGLVAGGGRLLSTRRAPSTLSP